MAVPLRVLFRFFHGQGAVESCDRSLKAHGSFPGSIFQTIATECFSESFTVLYSSRCETRPRSSTRLPSACAARGSGQHVRGVPIPHECPQAGPCSQPVSQAAAAEIRIPHQGLAYFYRGMATRPSPPPAQPMAAAAGRKHRDHDRAGSYSASRGTQGHHKCTKGTPPAPPRARNPRCICPFPPPRAMHPFFAPPLFPQTDATTTFGEFEYSQAMI